MALASSLFLLTSLALAGGLRHGLALRGAATGGAKAYGADDYAANPAMMWDAEASAFTATTWNNCANDANYPMAKNGGSASAVVRDEKSVSVGRVEGLFYMVNGPAYLDALFRGEGLTVEYCYTQTSAGMNYIGKDYALANYATDGVAHEGFGIQSSATAVRYRLDSTNAEKNTYPVSAATAEAFRTAAVVREGNAVRCYLNGELVGQFTKETRAGSSYLYVGNANYAEFARVHCVRVYGRALTDAEMRRQWKVDKARFE